MGDLPQYFKFVRWMLTSSLKKKLLNTSDTKLVENGDTSNINENDINSSYILKLFNSKVKIFNSLSFQLHNSYDVRSENLVLDQLIIPKLLFFFIPITYLVDIELIL